MKAYCELIAGVHNPARMPRRHVTMCGHVYTYIFLIHTKETRRVDRKSNVQHTRDMPIHQSPNLRSTAQLPPAHTYHDRPFAHPVILLLAKAGLHTCVFVSARTVITTQLCDKGGEQGAGGTVRWGPKASKSKSMRSNIESLAATPKALK